MNDKIGDGSEPLDVIRGTVGGLLTFYPTCLIRNDEMAQLTTSNSLESEEEKMCCYRRAESKRRSGKPGPKILRTAFLPGCFKEICQNRESHRPENII